MHIIKTTIALAAAACLGLMPVHAAERGDSSGARSKQLSSTHRTSSTDGGRISKTSRNRITRSHTSNRKSNAARRNHDRQRSAKSPDATRTVNDIQPSDVNIQVELPTRENENVAENDDKSATLFGEATVNDDEERP